MKWLILAACLGFCGALPSAQAAGSDFFVENREAGNSAGEVSTSAASEVTVDSGNRNYGILTGKPIVRLDPRYGDICLETIFGKVNGAQVRVTW